MLLKTTLALGLGFVKVDESEEVLNFETSQSVRSEINAFVKIKTKADKFPSL